MESFEEDLIIKMYVEDKLSAMQISESMRLSVSKVVRILDSRHIQKRSISDAITQINITKFHKKPFQLKPKLSQTENDLKITGIMLYWGEGAKTSGTVKLANSDPRMIRVFLLFLRNICGVEEGRIKMIIHMYPDQDKIFLQEFWSSITGIESENFYKPQILAGKKGTYKKKSLYGTATIYYGDKRLLALLLRWIEEYKNIFLA